MKNRIWIALGALALMVGAAKSQTYGNWGQKNQPTQSATSPSVPAVRVNVSGGVNPADTSFVPLQFNADGTVKTAEINFGAWAVFPNIIANQLGVTVTSIQDSSQAYATSLYRRLALCITPQFDSLSTVVRVAVQVRAHFSTSTDSSSAFPWYRFATRNTTQGTAVIDSIGHFGRGIDAVAQATSANSANNGLYDGEFMVKFDVARNDSTGAGFGKFGAYPKTMYIPLQDRDGWFSAPFTSIRVRVLNGVKSRFKLRVDMIGMQ